MENTYSLLKSIHILGVILLMGNIIVTAWWKVMADSTKNPSVIAFAQRQVTLTDFVFTAPGALLAVMAGDAMAYGFMPNSWNIQWLTWGRGLFIASGIIWLTVLIPTQIKQARMAQSFANTQTIPDEYWRLSKRWQIFGAIAVLLPMANIYWMVFKPM
ncbi:COG5528 Predicted integral membrane protein [Methylophilaceae bacterium]